MHVGHAIHGRFKFVQVVISSVNEGQNTSSMHDEALRRCLVQIEEKLGWGDAAQWTSHEFEELSLRIQEETTGVVSATTLKRVWGRVAYHSNPSRHTLNTLAKFVGYESWREWVEGEGGAETEGDGGAETEGEGEAEAEREGGSLSWGRRLTALRSSTRYGVISVIALVATVAVWAVLSMSPEPAPLDVDPSVAFTSRAVAEGLPNTVIFEYDVSAVDADSFFIQQTWDESRRVRVSAEQQTLTSTYYEPGFYNASLIANDQVLRSHPVHVTTNGWLALIEGDPAPVYLPEANQPGLGYLMVSEELVQERASAASGDPPIVSFYNVRSFEPLHTDAFRFEAVIRHTGSDRADPCKRAEVAVIGEQSALVFLVGIRGCVGDFQAMFGDTLLNGSTTDLSSLGTDMRDWQRVRMLAENRIVRVQIGDNEPLTTSYSMDIGRVVGLQFRFAGSGALDHVTLSDLDGEVVYDESFE